MQLLMLFICVYIYIYIICINIAQCTWKTQHELPMSKIADEISCVLHLFASIHAFSWQSKDFDLERIHSKQIYQRNLIAEKCDKNCSRFRHTEKQKWRQEKAFIWHLCNRYCNYSVSITYRSPSFVPVASCAVQACATCNSYLLLHICASATVTHYTNITIYKMRSLAWFVGNIAREKNIVLFYLGRNCDNDRIATQFFSFSLLVGTAIASEHTQRSSCVSVALN